jgi:hypothetical protein
VELPVTAQYLIEDGWKSRLIEPEPKRVESLKAKFDKAEILETFATPQNIDELCAGADVVVLDTPPARNALDFLDAPERMTRFVEGRGLRLLLGPRGGAVEWAPLSARQRDAELRRNAAFACGMLLAHCAAEVAEALPGLLGGLHAAFERGRGRGELEELALDNAVGALARGLLSLPPAALPTAAAIPAIAAALPLRADHGETAQVLATLGDALKFVTITSEASLSAGAELSIAVAPSNAAKCERCWHYRDDVGHDAANPTICARCTSNLFGAGEVRRVA